MDYSAAQLAKRLRDRKIKRAETMDELFSKPRSPKKSKKPYRETRTATKPAKKNYTLEDEQAAIMMSPAEYENYLKKKKAK